MPSTVSKICLLVATATVASAQVLPPCTECFVGYSGARVQELCGHDGVTCDETSCTSPYNVNYGPDAVGCKAGDTAAVQDAIANGMFGLKDVTDTCSTCNAGSVADGGVPLVDGRCEAWCSAPNVNYPIGFCGTGADYKTSGSTDCQSQTRDCSAWCLWDLSTKGAAKRHFKWDNKKECWKRKRGSKCSGSQGNEKVNALAHFEVQCQEPPQSCSEYQGQEYCCDRGFTKWGDGSACQDCKNQNYCAMWGNAAFPRCTDHQV